MQYFLTEQHQLFRESFRGFLEKEIRPRIDTLEALGEVPRDIYKLLGDMGYLGLSLPEAYGGSNLDAWYSVIFTEELSRMNSGGFGAAIGAHSGLAMTHINAAGTSLQKEAYLIPGIQGERIGCLAVTEPDGGSDVQAIRTTAIKDGNDYIVNGSKTFITNGVNSDYMVTAVKTDPSNKAKGISMLIIDRDLPGVSAHRLDKLGWKASDTGEIAFADVRVPAAQLLGVEGQGFFYIMQHFVTERLAMAVSGYAAAAYAVEVTLQYMDQRTAFGKKINKFQVLRHRIAQMSAEIAMNKAFVYSLYRRYIDGDYLVKEASMAKLLATQLSDKVCTECLQMYGGYGYMEDYPLARMYRDSRLGQIGGGTSEILCEIISRMLIDRTGYSSTS